jgi:hypothetical protein
MIHAHYLREEINNFPPCGSKVSKGDRSVGFHSGRELALKNKKAPATVKRQGLF